MKHLLVYFLLLASLGGYAQTTIGSWRSHVPMSSFRWIGETSTHIYAANQYGVLVYDRAEQSATPLTKVSALSQADITAFACDPESGVCVIGYSNGNLDIISEGNTVSNQPALMNSQSVGNKAINQITFDDTYIWLATGVGILQISLETFNVQEYTRISFNGQNQPVQRFLFARDSLYLVSEEHILRTHPNTLFAIPTYKEVNWPVSVTNISQLIEFDDQIYGVYDSPFFSMDSLYILIGNSFVYTPLLAEVGINYIDVKDDQILVSQATNIAIYNTAFEQQANIFTYGPPGLIPAQVLFSDSAHIIAADIQHGGVYVPLANPYGSEIFAISSPQPSTAVIDALSLQNETIYALPGGSEFSYNRPHVHKFMDEDWTSNELINSNYSIFVNGNELVERDEQLYVGSDRGGIAVCDPDLELVNVYNDENSPLDDPLPPDYNYFGVAGMDLDDAGNIYVSHNKSTTPLKILLTNGNWVEISFEDPDLTAPKTSDLLVLEDDIVAMIIIDVGVLFYNTNGTPANTDDDEYQLFTSSPSQGSLPSSQVVCMAEDNDGELWVGTAEGIGIIYNPDLVFDGTEKTQQIIVNQDGYNGYLFGTETVEAIAVDGANRKWVGTFNSGLFLVSADGLEQIHHFTVDNSPLIDNKIADIAIQPQTGEVFVASGGALVSYRSDATAGLENLENIKIFPNPVKSGYNGPIAISNLTTGATIRVTDVSGNLVFETIAQGGQATWNGANLNGERVNTGVFLVHIVASDGSVGVTRKILVQR